MLCVPWCFKQEQQPVQVTSVVMFLFDANLKNPIESFSLGGNKKNNKKPEATRRKLGEFGTMRITDYIAPRERSRQTEANNSEPGASVLVMQSLSAEQIKLLATSIFERRICSGATSTTAPENAFCFCESKVFCCKVSRLLGTLGHSCRPILAFSDFSTSFPAHLLFCSGKRVTVKISLATQCFVYLLCSSLP